MDRSQLIDEAIAAFGDGHSPEDIEMHHHNLRELIDAMSRFGNKRDDPVRMIQSYLGDRWSSLIMHLLRGGMLRTVELRRLINVVSAERQISQRMLTLKLRVLERDGLLVRSMTDHVPPRVEYQLTTLGHGAYEHFSSLIHWSERATNKVLAARRAFDLQHPDFFSELERGGARTD